MHYLVRILAAVAAAAAVFGAAAAAAHNIVPANMYSVIHALQ